MVKAIPHLHITRTGHAHWNDVPVGEYRIVTLHGAALHGKEVLVQKNADGTATVHLHPEHVEKSFSDDADIFAINPYREILTIGNVERETTIRKAETKLPPLPTQIVQNRDMHGNHHYLPMEQEELMANAYPIHNNLSSGKVGTKNGYVHSLPQDEKKMSDDYSGAFHDYDSLGLTPAMARNGMNDHLIPHYDYRQYEDMDDDKARRALKTELLRNGAIPHPQDEMGTKYMLPSPSGDWYYLDTKAFQFPDGLSNRWRHDVIPHIASAIMNPAEIWEQKAAQENGDTAQRVHTLYPTHEHDRRFSAGITLHAHQSAFPKAWSVHSAEVPGTDNADNHRHGRLIYLKERGKKRE